MSSFDVGWLDGGNGVTEREIRRGIWNGTLEV